MASSRDRENHPESHYLIEGNFKPAKGTRLLKAVIKVLGGFFAIVIVASLAVYGITVHLSSQTSNTVKQTTQLQEDNHALQIRLEQVKSFKHVEAAAGDVSYLHTAKNALQVTALPEKPLPEPPDVVQHPRVFGY